MKNFRASDRKNIKCNKQIGKSETKTSLKKFGRSVLSHKHNNIKIDDIYSWSKTEKTRDNLSSFSGKNLFETKHASSSNEINKGKRRARTSLRRSNIFKNPKQVGSASFNKMADVAVSENPHDKMAATDNKLIQKYPPVRLNLPIITVTRPESDEDDDESSLYIGMDDYWDSFDDPTDNVPKQDTSSNSFKVKTKIRNESAPKSMSTKVNPIKTSPQSSNKIYTKPDKQTSNKPTLVGSDSTSNNNRRVSPPKNRVGPSSPNKKVLPKLQKTGSFGSDSKTGTPSPSKSRPRRNSVPSVQSSGQWTESKSGSEWSTLDLDDYDSPPDGVSEH